MDANICDVNHLDSDVLLPPRKRLLACLKKQSGDGNGNGNRHPPPTSTSLTGFDARLSCLLRSHLRNDNPSQEEIVAATRTAVEAAAKAAAAARAAAQEKAVVAANAMAAAKMALELVAAVDEPETSGSTAKNRTKKHVEVQMLYDRKKPRLENGKKSKDGGSSRKPHGSPRNSKNAAKFKKTENGDAERAKSNGKEEHGSGGGLGRKRGRMKQKKLPLSICHDRDQASPKDRHRSKTSEKSNSLNDKPSFPVGPSANGGGGGGGGGGGTVERNPPWKCQAFKTPACVKQNKAVQS